VTRAQEQQPGSSPPRHRVDGAHGREREPGVEREPGFAEKVPATAQVAPVVHVTPVRRASAGGHGAGAAELGQVVRDEVLRLAGESHELADPPIATAELDDELPAQWIAQQPEDLRRLGRTHLAITSGQVDSLQVDARLWDRRDVPEREEAAGGPAASSTRVG